MLTIKFKKLKENAVLPKYALPGDAAFDIFSAEDFILESGKYHGFSSGVAMELPLGYFMRISPKSGHAIKNGIDVLGGIVDNGYRGELVVILINHGETTKEFKTGDKLAQGIVHKIEEGEVVEVSELSDTQRGTGGFGSTGK